MTSIIETLKACWVAELGSELLQDVPATLKKQVQGFIEHLAKELGMPNISSFQATINQREIQMAEYLWDDLLALRKNKIQAATSAGMKVTELKLLDFELKYYMSIAAATLAYGEDAIIMPQVQTRPGDLFNCIFVRFIKDSDAILDPEVREHGPFKTEDIAYLPKKMAELLISDGKAQRISIG